ncbi:MAG: glycosyltransferase [Patescibacteria group bacterium]
MSPVSSRIAVFSLAYAPHEAGAEIAVREIMERMPTTHFTVFAQSFDASLPILSSKDNISLHRVGAGKNIFSKLLYIMRAWRAAESAHKNDPFTAVWAVMAAYAGGAALLFKLRHPRIPLLLTLQEGDSEKHILRRVFLFYPLWRLIFKKADHVQAISSYLADFARRHGAACPIDIIPNGVDVEKIKSQILNLKSDEKNKKDFRIITTSRLVNKNGIDTLLRASAILKKKNIPFELWIVGSGPEERRLKALAAELDLEDKVVWHGSVPAEAIPSYLKAATVFVRASRSEGLGNSFLEAMASGLPIIGTPVGGIPDFLKDGETGLFTDVDDSHDLAWNIERLFADIHLRNRLIVNGQALVRDQYSWNYVVKEMLNIFSTLCVRYRIIIASGIVPPEIGGPAYYAKELSQALEIQGNKARLIAYGRLKRLPTGLRHIAYSFKLLFSLIFSRPSFLIALDTFSVGFPAVLMGKLMGVPVMVRTGGDFLWEFYVERTGEKIMLSDFYRQPRAFTLKERIIFRLTGWTLLHAKFVIFSTPYQRDIFIPAYGINESRTAIIENCYDVPMASEEPAQKNFICFTRQLVWKNINTLERAFEKAKINSSDILLETGTLPRAEYLEKLKACYAVILVSLGDISPNMILEAIAYGKPFILTTENGLENRLSGIGLRVNPQDETAITEAISHLADNHVYKKEKKKISTFSFRHSYEDIAREFLTLFQL